VVAMPVTEEPVPTTALRRLLDALLVHGHLPRARLERIAGPAAVQAAERDELITSDWLGDYRLTRHARNNIKEHNQEALQTIQEPPIDEQMQAFFRPPTPKDPKALQIDMPGTPWQEILARLAINALATAIDREHYPHYQQAGQPPSWVRRPTRSVGSSLAARELKLQEELRDAHQAALRLEKTGQYDPKIPNPRALIAQLSPLLHNTRAELQAIREPGKRIARTRHYLLRIPAIEATTSDGPKHQTERLIPVRLTPLEWYALEEWRWRATPNQRRDHPIYRLEAQRLRARAGMEGPDEWLGVADILRQAVYRDWPHVLRPQTLNGVPDDQT
jgi:hypothetical protein